MSRSREEVEVFLDDVDFFCNENSQGMYLKWSGNIGFGEYVLYKNADGQFMCDSEYMETEGDRWFLKLLLDQLRDLVTEKATEKATVNMSGE